LVDAHPGELKAAGEQIFPLVEADLRQQACGNWQTMMCESLVRACTARYTASTAGVEAAAREVAAKAPKVVSRLALAAAWLLAER
jgi:hypothetical protein